MPLTCSPWATRCPRTMYAAKSTALASASATPSGSPSSLTSVRRYTPPTASASAAAFRHVRVPSAASAITGRNSIAATVPSGSRSIAR